MKHVIAGIFSIFFLISVGLAAEKPELKDRREKESYSLGFQFGKNNLFFRVLHHIGEGYVNLTDDNGRYKIIWQNYTTSESGSSGTATANYTFDSNEQSFFRDSLRTFGIKAHSDATSNPTGNVTVQSLAYTWNTGKLFEEPQNLYANVKNYTYEYDSKRY